MTASALHVPLAPLPADCRDAAALLNRGCICNSVDHDRLRRALEGGATGAGGFSYAELLASRPYLFSDTTVFVAEAHLHFMAELIGAIERVVALTSVWRERVFAHAPGVRAPFAQVGNRCLSRLRLPSRSGRTAPDRDQHQCRWRPAQCQAVARPACLLRPAGISSSGTVHGRSGLRGHVPRRMASGPWRSAAGARIAIVDEAPAGQYLAPEFELFRQLFESSGIATVVADPGELSFDGSRLLYGGQVIDLVYNRLTDFSLDEPQNASAAGGLPRRRGGAYATSAGACALRRQTQSGSLER